MKSTFYLLTILSTLLLISCKDDDTQPDTETELPTEYQELGIVTGLDLFDATGQTIGRWETPNHKPGEAMIFPNPNNGVIFVSSQEAVNRLWLIPAECMLDTINLNVFALSQSLTYEVTELENAQIKNAEISNLMQFTLNFSDVNEGFYRFFYQLENGDLFWQNMYIDPDYSGMVDFDILDNACN